MKKLFALSFFAMVLSLTAIAQKVGGDPDKLTAKEKKAVEEIRQRYSDMKKMIELMGEGPDWQDRAVDADSPGGWPPEYFHVKIVQNLPATGYHEENVKMFFEEEEGAEDVIYPPLRLAFASSKYNFAAREFYEEFLYDKQGNLIFIFAQEPDLDKGVIVKYRFYIKDSKVIWTIVKDCSFEDGSETEVYASSALIPEYRKSLDYYADYSNRIRTLFDAIDKAKKL